MIILVIFLNFIELEIGVFPSPQRASAKPAPAIDWAKKATMYLNQRQVHATAMKWLASPAPYSLLPAPYFDHDQSPCPIPKPLPAQAR